MTWYLTSHSTATQKGEYFHYALTASIVTFPQVQAKSLYGATQTATVGRSYVPPATESYTYDSDGNLTADGRWTAYVWDGENRLVEMRRDTASPAEARQKLTFEYDHLGRRIRKTYFTYSGGWVEQRDTAYLYDGWNMIAEVDANNGNATLRTYVWGTDLSGSRTGAGGVGGLLWVNNAQSGLPMGIQFAAYDGNGNVAGLFAASDGSSTARYEYGPFGEPIRMTGTLAKANPVRWSTKVTDDEGGLVYYGYRYYNPSTGRWPSRDPLGEPGFELLRGKQPSVSAGDPNRYLFVKNNPLQNIDPDGLDLITITYTNGTTVTYGTFSSPNMGQLMGALTNAAGSISGITIKGHACCTIQSFGDDLITMDSTGTKILGTDGTDVAGALKSALAPGAWIYLAGCGSGRGAGNIAQQMSTVLPGVTVSGHQGVAALNVPFCGCAIGKRNYYINGTLQHSAW